MTIVSEVCLSWLPANAVAPPLMRGAVSDMVDAWSRAWFADESVRASGSFARIAAPQTELRNARWRKCHGGLAIGLPASGPRTIGASVLAVSPTGINRSEADVMILENVGEECLVDLQIRAVTAFGLPAQSTWRETEAGHRDGPAHRMEIAGPMWSHPLTLEISNDLFIRTFRAKSSPTREAKPLGHPAQALGTLPLSLSALLGRCDITIAELHSLAEGDVLILDRALDAQLPLAIGGAQARRGTCTLAEREKGVALEIMEAPSA